MNVMGETPFRVKLDHTTEGEQHALKSTMTTGDQCHGTTSQTTLRPTYPRQHSVNIHHARPGRLPVETSHSEVSRWDTWIRACAAQSGCSAE